MQPFERAAHQLYRDCLRLVRHVAPGTTAKSLALRTSIRQQFRADYKTPEEVEAAKANAVRALSNYMLFTSGQKDQKVKKAMNEYHQASIPGKQDEESGKPTKA